MLPVGYASIKSEITVMFYSIARIEVLFCGPYYSLLSINKYRHTDKLEKIIWYIKSSETTMQCVQWARLATS